jgi:hypothetical protein
MNEAFGRLLAASDDERRDMIQIEVRIFEEHPRAACSRQRVRGRPSSGTTTTIGGRGSDALGRRETIVNCKPVRGDVSRIECRSSTRVVGLC